MSSKQKSKKKVLFSATVLILIALIIAVVGSTLYSIIRERFLYFNYPVKYEEYIDKYAAENSVDKFLIYAIIKTESNFDPNAVSSVGARGLMQIISDTFEWIRYRLGDNEDMTYDTMFDPEQNIRYGCYLVGYLIKHFDSKDAAICAYHAGIGKVDSWLQNSEYSDDGKKLNIIPISDTEYYLKKIKNALNIYNKLYTEEN